LHHFPGEGAMADFGYTLKQLRMDQGLTQEDLGNLIGRHRNTIARWEGGTPPKRKMLLQLADALFLYEDEIDQLLLAAGYAEATPDEKLPMKTRGHKHPLQKSRSTPQRSPARCDYYEHISRPRNYIERIDVITMVRTSLLRKDLPITLTSAVQSPKLNALYGMGGIGKSVIARTLCDDSAIQDAFPDGILWLTLGKKPELVPAMRSWINVLGGTISENAPTVESLKNILAILLKDRGCLLILDDVWHFTEAEPFFVGGPHCRMLLTTRKAEIAVKFGATVQPIPLMTEIEAITLLDVWSKGHLAQADQVLKRQIVKQLGYLPLAVKLAGAQLQHIPPDEWLQTFDVRKLKYQEVDHPHDSVVLTFELSLEDLDKLTRQLYVALAIFKEDEVTPQVGIERLWKSLSNLDAHAIRDLLDNLASRALLDLIPDPSSRPRAVHLHDLLHNLISVELGDARLAAHQALLDAYRTTCQGTGWNTAEDDGYLYDHLTYHLEAVYAKDELKALFADQHWLSVRLPHRNYTYDGYLEDLSLAWNSADIETRQQIEANREPTAFAECIRYILIHTSINSIAKNYVPELIERAIEAELLEPSQVLSLAVKVREMKKQVKIYLAVLSKGKLNQDQQKKLQNLVLQHALALEDKSLRLRIEILIALVPRLEGDQRTHVLEQVLQDIFDPDNEWEDTELFYNDYFRAKLLVTLAPHLSIEQHSQALKQIFEDTSTLDKRLRAKMFIALVPYLSSEQRIHTLEQAFQDTLALDDNGLRVEVFSILTPYLSDEQRAHALEQAFQDALLLEAGELRAHALIALIPHLSETQQKQALEQAFQHIAVADDRQQAQMLIAIAPYLTGTLLEKALQTALAIDYGGLRVEVLSILSSFLSGDLRTRALEQALQDALRDDAPELLRAVWLTDLVPYLIGEQRTRALEQALQAIQKIYIDIDTFRVNPLAALAPHLGGTLLERALQMTVVIHDEQERAASLTALAPHLSGDQRTYVLEQAYQLALTVPDPWARAESLAALAPHLSGDQQTHALEQAFQGDLAIREPAFGGPVAPTVLAPHLTGLQLEQVFQITLEYPNEAWRAEMLTALIPYLTKTMIEQTLQNAMTFHDAFCRADVLTALAPHLSGEQQAHALEQAYQDVLAVPYEVLRAKALAALVPHLSEEQRHQVLEQAFVDTLADDNDLLRAEALTALAPHFTSRLQEHAFQVSLTLQNKFLRVQVLSSLAPHLTGSLLEQALQTSLEIHDEKFRTVALMTLVPRFTGDQRTHLMMQILDTLAYYEKDLSVAVITKLSPLILAQPSELKSIRIAILETLPYLKHWSRQEVLKKFCAQKILTSPLFSPEVLGTIASHIIEICEQWHWL